MLCCRDFSTLTISFFVFELKSYSMSVGGEEEEKKENYEARHASAGFCKYAIALEDKRALFFVYKFLIPKNIHNFFFHITINPQKVYIENHIRVMMMAHTHIRR
jgi:hypothetical protein